jgi:hypothetical protein
MFGDKKEKDEKGHFRIQDDAGTATIENSRFKTRVGVANG